eukprot:scaffold92926_cov51-Cyclotella_meneghiniana.AAC.1
MYSTTRHRPSSVGLGLGAEILLKGGCAPGCPPIFHISPYKITSDFTGFNTGSVGFHRFSTGRRSSQHCESKVDMRGAETVVSGGARPSALNRQGYTDPLAHQLEVTGDFWKQMNFRSHISD